MIPDESPPNRGKPIRYSRRKLSESRNAYPLHRMIANRLFEEYSGSVCESIRFIEGTSRGVYGSALGTRGAYAIRPYLTNRKSYP